MNPQKLAEAIAYFEKKPRAFDEACRQIPDLFIARALQVTPCQMHVDLQRHLDAPGGTKTTLLPRNHGKTTQVSIGRIAWEIGNNPNLRVQVVQATLPDAKKTVKAIKEVMESEVYARIFPQIRPNPDDWGVMSLTVMPRKAGLRDANVTAQPIFGKAGQRSDLLLLDDIENFDNSIRQDTVREQVKEAYRETWLPTLEPGGREWRNATPWHIDGITMNWWDEAAKEAPESLFVRKCEGTLRSPWPEKFGPEVLANFRKKMGEIAYSRAFLLQAITGEEVIFKEEDLRRSFAPLPAERRMRGRTRVAACDLAFSDTETEVKRGKHSADFAVLAIADIDADAHVWMVRVFRKRCSYPDFKKLLIEECRRNGVQKVKIESNGPQKGLRQDLGKALSEIGISHDTGKDRDRDKIARASMQQAVVEQGRFHLRTDDRGELLPDMRVMFDELRTFPVGVHDDTVDTAIDLMSEARKGNPMEGRERRGVDPRLVSDIERDLDEMEAVVTGPREYARYHGLEDD